MAGGLVGWCDADAGSSARRGWQEVSTRALAMIHAVMGPFVTLFRGLRSRDSYEPEDLRGYELYTLGWI